MVKFPKILLPGVLVEFNLQEDEGASSYTVTYYVTHPTSGPHTQG
jgi:hypothetical protein